MLLMIFEAQIASSPTVGHLKTDKSSIKQATTAARETVAMQQASTETPDERMVIKQTMQSNALGFSRPDLFVERVAHRIQKVLHHASRGEAVFTEDDMRPPLDIKHDKHVQHALKRQAQAGVNVNRNPYQIGSAELRRLQCVLPGVALALAQSAKENSPMTRVKDELDGAPERGHA